MLDNIDVCLGYRLAQKCQRPTAIVFSKKQIERARERLPRAFNDVVSKPGFDVNGLRVIRADVFHQSFLKLIEGNNTLTATDVNSTVFP